MDNETNLLQQKIQSANDKYMFFGAILGLLYIIVLIQHILSPSTFTFNFSASIALTLILGFVIFAFLANFNTISNKAKEWGTNYYKYIYLTLGVIIPIGILITILHFLGLFSPPSTDNNTKSILLNYFIIISLIYIILYGFCQN